MTFDVSVLDLDSSRSNQLYPRFQLPPHTNALISLSSRLQVHRRTILDTISSCSNPRNSYIEDHKTLKQQLSLLYISLEETSHWQT